MNSRAFKFRVWDNSKNEWFPIKGAMAFLLNNDGNENLVFITKTGPYPIPQTGQENGGRNRFSVQQFTGLKDKNGNNIYEGDILEYNHGNGINVGYVGFTSGIFFLNYSDENNDELGYLLVSNIKIIGNIFENKELLK